MKKELYIISDAAKKVHVETHVLRHWEEELELNILRNDMGHRLYTKEDIQIFLNIRTLKEQGFQLKSIKMLMPEIKNKKENELTSLFLLRDKLNSRAEELAVISESSINTSISKDEKLEIFEKFLTNIFEKCLKNERAQLARNISTNVCDDISEELNTLLDNHLEKQELHFKELDALLRSHQKALKETAVTDIRKKRKLSLTHGIRQ